MCDLESAAKAIWRACEDNQNTRAFGAKGDMNMNRVSLAFVRVIFFVMLFVSTACNKMDRSLTAEVPQPRPETVATSEARIRELDARVLQLEGQIQAMNKQNAALSDIPGGMNWD